MKKFTFIIALIMIAFIAGAQNKKDLLEIKIQQSQEKFSQITQKSELLHELAKIQIFKQEKLIKSAATKLKLDSTVSQTFDYQTQLWQFNDRYEYIYDEDFKSTSWLWKKWNPTTKNWNTTTKLDMEYDNMDNLNLILKNEVDYFVKFLFYYSPGGLLDSSFFYRTETAGVSWTLETKEIYYYNASKQLLKKDYWDRINGLVSYHEYTYTASGKIKTDNIIIWRDGQEILWNKDEYDYDDSGKLSSIESSNWNEATFALEKGSRTTYQYNTSGDVSVEIRSTWNNMSWLEFTKRDYKYNTEGDLIVETESSRWNTPWQAIYKDEYTYGTNNFSDVVSPSSVDHLSMITLLSTTATETPVSKKIITGIKKFIMYNASWINTEKTVFYYSGGTSTNIDESGNILFTAYPNPASNSVIFRWKGNYESLSLEMYQITGAKVMEQIAYSGRPVSISHLQNGVYLYKLLIGQQMVHTGKMIKR